MVALGLASVAIYAVQGGGLQAAQAPAQAPAGGRGGAGGGGGFGGGGRGNPEQDALEAKAPQIPYDAVSLPLMPEGHTIGETVGVAMNSKKHLFVYTRSGNAGPAKGATAAQLFEFDQNNKFVKQWGQDMYGSSFAHVVRVDKDDNVWAVDEGSNMVIKFNPQGLVTLVLGRKDEAIDYMERTFEEGRGGAPAGGGGGGARGGAPAGAPPAAAAQGGRGAAAPAAARGCGAGTFARPTDVTWDPQGNIYVSDGYTNSRVAKFNKDGDFVKCIGASGRGSAGNGEGQFSTPHTIAADAKGLIYVGDRGNQRIQVLDADLNVKKVFRNVRAPWGMCITPPNASGQQFLFSADAGGKIYKLDLDGNLLGWFGSNGKKVGQFYWVHSMHCVSETEVYTGEAQNWRIQKLTLKPAGSKMATGK
jgi:hypothetical protein